MGKVSTPWSSFFFSFMNFANCTGPPVEELERVSRELKRSATLQVQEHCELSSTLELLTLAAYVSKDGLVSHHWKERPIGQTNFICPSTGKHQGQEVGVGV